jgi:deoxyadenosine/deoxycytidine kinase
VHSPANYSAVFARRIFTRTGRTSKHGDENTSTVALWKNGVAEGRPRRGEFRHRHPSGRVDCGHPINIEVLVCRLSSNILERNTPPGISTYALGLLGLPGTGKSSASLSIGAAGIGITRRATDEFHRPESRMSAYIERLFKGAREDVALACQVEALARRAVLQRTATVSDCIDEPVEAVLAHAIAMKTVGIFAGAQRDSWMLLYDVVRETLPRANILVLLTCEREELQRRIAQRGRRRDLSVTRDYLDAFDASLRSVAAASGSRVLIVDTTSISPAAVAATIIQEHVGSR